jgi:hypothetical protein
MMPFPGAVQPKKACGAQFFHLFQKYEYKPAAVHVRIMTQRRTPLHNIILTVIDSAVPVNPFLKQTAFLTFATHEGKNYYS